MSGDMIDRVALSICRVAGEPDGCVMFYRDAARAAIKAMQEPTEVMYCAGDERIIEALHDLTGILRNPTPAQDAWRAMISAALSDSLTEVVPEDQKTL